MVTHKSCERSLVTWTRHVWILRDLDCDASLPYLRVAGISTGNVVGIGQRRMYDLSAGDKTSVIAMPVHVRSLATSGHDPVACKIRAAVWPAGALSSPDLPFLPSVSIISRRGGSTSSVTMPLAIKIPTITPRYNQVSSPVCTIDALRSRQPIVV